MILGIPSPQVLGRTLVVCSASLSRQTNPSPHSFDKLRINSISIRYVPLIQFYPHLYLNALPLFPAPESIGVVDDEVTVPARGNECCLIQGIPEISLSFLGDYGSLNAVGT